jgi:hypothetical protein
MMSNNSKVLGEAKAPGAICDYSCALCLSDAQLGIWFAQKLHPSSAAYNIGEYIQIHGAIDRVLFETALRQVVMEAETLSVRFVEQGDDVKQFVGMAPAWAMTFIDVTHEVDPSAAAEVWMNADMARPVNPVSDSLFMYALFKLAPDRFFWYARYHHLIVDGASMAMVAQRVAHVYTALASDQRPDNCAFGSLAVLVEDDAAYRASEQFNRDRNYWLERLADRPEPMSLSGRLFVQSEGVLRTTAVLPSSNVGRLRNITAAMAILVHRLTETKDLVLGFVVAARVNPEARRIPGMSSNVVLLRLALRSGMRVSEVVSHTSRQVRELLQHQRYPIANLRRDDGRIAGDHALYSL